MLQVAAITAADAARPQCTFRNVSCHHCYRSYKPNELEAHYKTCPEMKIDCPKGGKDCGGRSSHGHRKRRLMTKHLETECAQWKCVNSSLRQLRMLTVTPCRCRAVGGCRTRSTYANLAKHEKGCLAAHEETKSLTKDLQSLKEEVKGLCEAGASLDEDYKILRKEAEKLKKALDFQTTMCSALVEEKRELTARLAEEEKRRAEMVTSSTTTDKIVSSASAIGAGRSTSAEVLTPSSRVNVDGAGQASKRSSRIAAKRRASQVFPDASDGQPSPNRRSPVKPEPAEA